MAQRKIIVFFSTVAIIVTVLGSLLYALEGPNNGFSSIPMSIYWAIVTITTVGYGDIVPQTDVGKFIAAFTMLLGYSILAVPTGIITQKSTKKWSIAETLFVVAIAQRAAMILMQITAGSAEQSCPNNPSIE